MNDFYLKATAKTPEVRFESESGNFLFEGRSILENSVDFYKPLNEWLDSFLEVPTPKIHMDVKFEYFNTSSSKCLVEILRKLEKAHMSGKTKVHVDWYYEEEDEDMLDSGEDFRQIVNFPVQLCMMDDNY
ncbi:hypothetical protein FUAX_16470 [Fulvitalea axinellae]|uniref:SiaC family regulatory phosphoprotein domain-containing protein n=1 Tax=Fulvitalea axinellae TaxID=1182444 RepID=A0AAU9CIT8_9BACT|nr:hypothetical protein FUAX_16470 [Fulvitalea axinellae]